MDWVFTHRSFQLATVICGEYRLQSELRNTLILSQRCLLNKARCIKHQPGNVYATAASVIYTYIRTQALTFPEVQPGEMASVTIYPLCWLLLLKLSPKRRAYFFLFSLALSRNKSPFVVISYSAKCESETRCRYRISRDHE